MFFMLPTVALVYQDKITGCDLSWWDCAVTIWSHYDLAQPPADMPHTLIGQQCLDDDYWEE